MADIKFSIEKHFGKFSVSPKGWAKELNLVSWNDREAKFDLREWGPDHGRMGKGITLSRDELIALKELLNSTDF